MADALKNDLVATLKDVLPLLEYLAEEADPELDCAETGAVCASQTCRQTGCVSARFYRVSQTLAVAEALS